MVEIAQWKLTDEYKLVGYGYAEKQTKTKKKSTALLNNHELPPCKNGATKYYGDILVFKVNDKLQLLDYTVDEYSVDYQDLFFKDELSDSEDEEDEDDFEEPIDEIEDELDGLEDDGDGMFKGEENDDEDIDYGDEVEAEGEGRHEVPGHGARRVAHHYGLPAR